MSTIGTETTTIADDGFRRFETKTGEMASLAMMNKLATLLDLPLDCCAFTLECDLKGGLPKLTVVRRLDGKPPNNGEMKP